MNLLKRKEKKILASIGAVSQPKFCRRYLCATHDGPISKGSCVVATRGRSKEFFLSPSSQARTGSGVSEFILPGYLMQTSSTVEGNLCLGRNTALYSESSGCTNVQFTTGSKVNNLSPSRGRTWLRLFIEATVRESSIARF